MGGSRSNGSFGLNEQRWCVSAFRLLGASSPGYEVRRIEKERNDPLLGRRARFRAAGLGQLGLHRAVGEDGRRMKRFDSARLGRWRGRRALLAGSDRKTGQGGSVCQGFVRTERGAAVAGFESFL